MRNRDDGEGNDDDDRYKEDEYGFYEKYSSGLMTMPY